MGEVEAVRDLALDLSAAAAHRPDLRSRADRVVQRLGQGRFHVAVLGEFKRGKSTLVNALLGGHVLPTGVVPLTAVITEVTYGEPGASAVGADGARVEVRLSELGTYVTEDGNPRNVKGVSRVEVRWPCPLLESGLVLVDTPGVGSVHEHNTEVGHAARSEADGAIVVLGADAPLSDREAELLHSLAERGTRTFLVVNKCDRLQPHERAEVHRFIATRCRDLLGHEPELFLVSARDAAGDHHGDRQVGDSLDWERFRAALEEFVRCDLESARLGAARSELGRIAADLRDEVLVERATIALDIDVLGDRVEHLRAVAEDARLSFEADRLLLDREVDELVARIGDSLREFARSEARSARGELRRIADGLALGDLESGLQRAITEIVRERFEAFRLAEADAVDDAWAEQAERFRRRTEARVNAVRDKASDLLELSLSRRSIPPIEEESEKFSYLFVRVGSTGEMFGRAASRLLPPNVLRRRMMARAEEELARELDKHAGRARWDFAQRLVAVRGRFEQSMRDELHGAIGAILDAADRAQQVRTLTQDEQRRRAEAEEQILAVVDRALDGSTGS